MMARPNPRRASTSKKIEGELRDLALGYPGAHEEFPWGERVIKVKGKVFLFLGHAEDEELHLSVKLPASNGMALLLPFAAPTGYGLGKSGWVSARFPPRARVPVDMLRQWIDESYRAVAPKKLIAALTEATVSAPPGAAKAKPRAPKRTAR
jgi:predicted DNA-binding protein (MmcQ/YjbR family)